MRISAVFDRKTCWSKALVEEKFVTLAYQINKPTLK